MSAKLFFKNYKLVLGILAIFFILLSITALMFQNYFLFRLLRGIICYTTLLYLIISHGKNIQKWLVGFLFFYGASSITTVWYENGTMASISMILNFIAFLILLLYIVPKVNLKNLSKTFTFLFIVIVMVNGYLFFQLIELMKEMILSNTQYIFMILDALCGILLIFLALLYNHSVNTAQSMNFTILIFLLIFGEIFRGIAYYNLVYSTTFDYLARIFLVLSLYTFVHFSFLDLKNAKNIETSIT
ncbi:hypothetical protein [Aequorivita lipolytica]|uniref:Uncharacterized protein n=1 Tax=Aequorivita lipolytica TaxID=153267 RepID=A0A5C6YN00_9FLAO|nr:hypothetical protein [Aequorivita lipolytica]TXD68698.1 hypothetical protein ESV24_11070 [Aequorivita lipolytica]SRX53160.1 hypothetical protein AEQU2_02388 [Aequorivita lipolytica]